MRNVGRRCRTGGYPQVTILDNGRLLKRSGTDRRGGVERATFLLNHGGRAYFMVSYGGGEVCAQSVAFSGLRVRLPHAGASVDVSTGPDTMCSSFPGALADVDPLRLTRLPRPQLPRMTTGVARRYSAAAARRELGSLYYGAGFRASCSRRVSATRMRCGISGFQGDTEYTGTTNVWNGYRGTDVYWFYSLSAQIVDTYCLQVEHRPLSARSRHVRTGTVAGGFVL